MHAIVRHAHGGEVHLSFFVHNAFEVRSLPVVCLYIAFITVIRACTFFDYTNNYNWRYIRGEGGRGWIGRV